MHIVLLGDSIFDNQYYVGETEKSVLEHLGFRLPAGARATLLAVDGSVTLDVLGQVREVPEDATHIVISCGGNDALEAEALLGKKCDWVEGALAILEEYVSAFHRAYKLLLNEVMALKLDVTVCTVYDSVPGLSKEERLFLSLFNDIIQKEVLNSGIKLIDLRAVCTEAEDYSSVSPIEPSHRGGEKIAGHIIETL
jgi:hypothetical protein